MPNIVILDTESTGLPNDEWARVYELGAVALGPDGHVLGTFEKLWCPEVVGHGAERAMALSGRTPMDLVVSMPETTDDGDERAFRRSIVEAARQDFANFLTNFSVTEVWSYNSVFDETMLARSGFFLPWPDGAGCVMRLARQHMPHKEKDPSLGEAMHFFGIERRGDAHRALSDAIGAAGVYVACRERADLRPYSSTTPMGSLAGIPRRDWNVPPGVDTQSTYNAPVPTLSSIREVVEQERARLTGTQFTPARPWEP